MLTIIVWLAIGFGTSVLWLLLTNGERRHFWERRETSMRTRRSTLTQNIQR